jgi:hypothetical protein
LTNNKFVKNLRGNFTEISVKIQKSSELNTFIYVMSIKRGTERLSHRSVGSPYFVQFKTIKMTMEADIAK